MIVFATDWLQWSAIGSLIAAGATLLLAGATYLLVRTTQGLVADNEQEVAATTALATATHNQARSAGLALALQLEPRIVPVHEEPPFFDGPEDIGGTQSQHWIDALIVSVENAGSGVAKLTRAEIAVQPGWGPPDGVRFPGLMRSGSTARLRAEFTLPAEPNRPFPVGRNVNVRLRYEGAGGREYEIAFIWDRAAGSEGRWKLNLNEEVGHLQLPPLDV